METLRRLGLDTFAGRQAHALPFGIQKLAGVARALAAEPDMLLLDEPAAGLNVAETQALGEVITRLRRDQGLTILLVEHNMRLVMGISDRIVVLDEGRALTEGLPEEIARNPAVIEAYLGVVDRPEVMEEVQYGLIDRA
jgi:branched-chain amino acid transport system ATP-binding protein